MKKNWIYIGLAALGILIGYLIIQDFFSDNLKRSTGNPYAYSVDSLKKIDPEHIKYRETKRIRLPGKEPVSIDYYKGHLGIAYLNALQLIDTTGYEVFLRQTEGQNTGLSFSNDGTIYLGSNGTVHLFDQGGKELKSWDEYNNKAIITSVAFLNDQVYVADAGNRLVHRYQGDGTLLGSFDGSGRLEGDYGFILPSPYFDLGVNLYDELWVANPGLLKVENYSREGTLRAFWGQPSFRLEGFTGCCNPVYFDIMPDGAFVTSEKGLVRVKVYKRSGEFEAVVAGPEDFDDDSGPPDITSDENGRIYLLDVTRNMVRIFERNKG